MKSLIVFLLVISSHAFATPKVLTAGLYKGFGPTDESALMLGEIHLEVGEDGVAKLRFATGRKIVEDQIDLSLFVPLNAEERVTRDLKHVAAFRPMDREFPLIILNNSIPYARRGFFKSVFRAGLNRTLGGPDVTIFTGGMGDMIAPLVFFSPRQVAKGAFEKSLKRIEDYTSHKGLLPRIHLDGRAPAYCEQNLQASAETESTDQGELPFPKVDP